MDSLKIDRQTNPIDLVIDHNVPLPKKKTGRRGKWSTLAMQMKEGDSILLPSPHMAERLANNMRRLGFKQKTRKIAGEGWRIWRVPL